MCLVVVVALFFRAGAQWRFRGIDARLVTRGVTRVRGVRLALETGLERVGKTSGKTRSANWSLSHGGSGTRFRRNDRSASPSGASAAEAPVDVRVSSPPALGGASSSESSSESPSAQRFVHAHHPPDAPAASAASSDSRMFLSDAAFGTAAGDFGSGSAVVVAAAPAPRSSSRNAPEEAPRRDARDRGAAAIRSFVSALPRRRGDPRRARRPRTFRIVHPR